MLTGLASSWEGRFVAYSDNGDGPVHVWTIDTHELVATFPTILDAGGSRLAISADGNRVAVAAYGRKGVALYRVADGSCLWQQRRIVKVQQVESDDSRGRIWCVADAGPARLLDAASGSTLQAVAGVRWVCLHHAREEVVCFDGRQYRLMQEGVTPLAAQLESGPLAGAFSDSGFCLSEIAGPLRYFDLSSRHELHRLIPRAGCHWTGIGFVSAAQQFAVIRYSYESAGGIALELFDPVSGQLREVAGLPSPKYVFCERGALVLGSHGDLRRTSDGELVHHFHWFDP